MPTFEPWDVIKVPFPYTDRPINQRRPAVVLAAGSIEASHGLLWILMVTSAENRKWPDDVPVSNLSKAGLRIASVVRSVKIATIEAASAKRIGNLSSRDSRRVADKVSRLLSGALTVR
ncbi:MAG: type II toxin-antitoxin system PemK/MazF family toxin [Candidatus Cybelea sp.]